MTDAKSQRVPVAKESPDLIAEQIELLRQIFPQAFTEGRVDFEKLRATLGEVVDDRPERYSFAWAGKRDAIRLLQTPSRAMSTDSPRVNKCYTWCAKPRMNHSGKTRAPTKRVR